MNFDLKSFRKRFGLKQVEVAHLFNCGQSNISDIETGKRGLEEYQTRILFDKYGEEVVKEYLIPESAIHQGNINGDNINGHNVTVNKADFDKLISLLNKRDEQIDRLLRIIENLNIDFIHCGHGWFGLFPISSAAFGKSWSCVGFPQSQVDHQISHRFGGGGCFWYRLLWRW